jgi:hypothetical protein
VTAARSVGNACVEPTIAPEDRELIEELVTDGVCTRAQADALYARLEELMDGVMLGEITTAEALELMSAFTLAQHEGAS